MSLSAAVARLSRARHPSPFLRLGSSSATLRPYHATAARRALSESDHDQDPEERKQKIDHHKDDQLKKQKEGKGHWKEELSSNSESALKADRADIDDAGKHIEDMQKETAADSEENHEHSKK